MEFSNKRLDIILHTLITAEIAITSSHLSVLTNVSTRTVKKDIAELNEILIDFSVEIVSKTGVGYQLKIKDDFLFQQLLKEIEENNTTKLDAIPKFRYERVNYIIKKLLTIDYYLTLEDLMDELYISRSTLTADMKEIREILSEYNLILQTRPNYGIILEGSELSKRLCVSEFFFHSNIKTGYFAADNAMFVSSTNQHEIDFIRECLISLVEEFSMHMSDLSLQNFVIHILIAIRRWKFYNYIKTKDDLSYIDNNSKEYLAAAKLVSKIEKKFGILLPAGEVEYFALHFKSKHIAELEELNRGDLELVENTFYEIYRCLQQQYNYIVINKEQYEEYLRLHIPAMINRLKTGLVMRNPMIYDTLTKYPASTHITIQLSKIIENNFQAKMNKNEFAYLILYTNLLFHSEKNRKEKILLVCGRGRPETITLLNEINEGSSKVSSSIDICDVSSLDNRKLKDYHTIFSTVPLKNDFSYPYYFLDDNLGYYDQISRKMKLERISFKNIGKYLKSEFFCKNLKGTVRDEIFRGVSKIIGNSSLINNFWDAEHIISHETTKNVVFLHVLKPIKDNFIFIGILDKPIIWNKMWAQVIVFININDNFDDLINCYDFISEIFFRNEISSLLTKISNYEDLIRFWKGTLNRKKYEDSN